jgi:putative hemolysin
MLSLVIIFALLMGCSAFFSSSETALFSLSRVQVHRFKEEGGRFAGKLISLLRTPRQTLVTILFGNELANICMSIVGASIIHRAIDVGMHGETVIAVLFITPIVMIFCEIVPKNMALRYAEILAPVMVFPIHSFYKVITPLRVVLTWFAKRMVVLFGGDLERDEPMVMENEFRRLVDIGRREGAIEEEEREIIHKVFEFTDKRVGDIMTPVERVFMLPVDMPYDRLMEEIRSTQFSRVPFYEGDRRNVIGILHVRDLFSFNMRRKVGDEVGIRTLLRSVIIVDMKAPLENLLGEFQKGRAHMAIVLDEGGHIKGVVTMDDVLEELFGEIEE